MKILGVIPARLQSVRLPRKALCLIHGKPMIQWVYERSYQSSKIDGLTVATDSPEIQQVCAELRIPCFMTSPDHRSGTSRCNEVAASLKTDDIVVNIQGDEPLITADHIDSLVESFEDTQVLVASLAWLPTDADQRADRNVVKVVMNYLNDAMYFSRQPIPGAKHIGVYAYRRESLGAFCDWKPGLLEQTEGLEQLRFLENGISIRMVPTEIDTIGVDTTEDLHRVEEALR